MRTTVFNLLNRVPEHDSLTFSVLHRTKCKPMHFDWERFALTLNPNPNRNPKPNPTLNPKPNPTLNPKP